MIIPSLAGRWLGIGIPDTIAADTVAAHRSPSAEHDIRLIHWGVAKR